MTRNQAWHVNINLNFVIFLQQSYLEDLESQLNYFFDAFFFNSFHCM